MSKKVLILKVDEHGFIERLKNNNGPEFSKAEARAIVDSEKDSNQFLIVDDEFINEMESYWELFHEFREKRITESYIIGKTLSGKNIFSFPLHPEHKCFTAKDCDDAYQVVKKLQSESSDKKQFENFSLSANEYKNKKKRILIKNASN